MAMGVDLNGKSAAAQLQALLSPPVSASSQLFAQSLLDPLPRPLVPSSLGPALSNLLGKQQAESSRLTAELSASSTDVAAILGSAKAQLGGILRRTAAIRADHELLEDSLIDHRDALVSTLSQKDKGGATLRETLEALSEKRKEVELVRDWFAVLARAEELGVTALKAMERANLPAAFQGYVSLVDFVKTVHSGASGLALTSQLTAMTMSVWTSFIKTLSVRAVETLTQIGWPKPLVEPLDWSLMTSSDFQAAFVDLLVLEQLNTDHPLPVLPDSPNFSDFDTDIGGVKPLLALSPLVQPLLLRFRWQFEGTRGTNRIDKPEYPLSHVLNLLEAHERFVSEEVQDLLDANGFSHIDAMTDFTTLLLPPLALRLRHHVPQLLELPPILAHTIYQTLEFDTMLRSRGYRPRGVEGEWGGLSEVILGQKEWFDRWLEGEREFFDTRYYAAISAADAWHVVSEDDFDAGESTTGVRPSNSSLRVAELAEQLSTRYRPLPLAHTLPFFLSLHLPLLTSYAQRITAALQAFDSLAFGILPGGLGDGRAATAGVGGASRLVRAGVSARWMAEKCLEWGEDSFYLSLYDYLSSTSIPADLRPLAEPVLSASEGTVFDGERTLFAALADRADELLVRHVVRELLGELKAYLGRRWDFESTGEEEDLTLSPELAAPLSLFSTLLSTIVSAFPVGLATALYRRISSSLSAALYDRFLISRTWSEAGARQLNWDIEYGFLQAAREAGVQRGVARGWELFEGGGKILALPASSSGAKEGNSYSFGAIMQLAFDDAVPPGKISHAMEDLGVEEIVGRREVLQALLRKRPECWR